MSDDVVVELGLEPIELIVHLTAASDFAQPLATADGADFPAGAAIAMVFDDPDTTSWDAEIVGPNATWLVDKTDVAALLAVPVYAARVLYTVGELELVWMSGRVIRHD